jgi:hypothetical protein
VYPLRLSEESCLVKRVSSLLKPFIRDLGIEENVRLAQIRRDWHNLFRKTLSYHMSPFAFSNGELLVHVDSPAWMQELNFYRIDILKKMHPYEVKTIRFRLGRVSAKTSSDDGSRKPETRKLTDEEDAFVQEAISGFHDEGLKTTVKTAMVRAISSGKTKVR